VSLFEIDTTNNFNEDNGLSQIHMTKQMSIQHQILGATNSREETNVNTTSTNIRSNKYYGQWIKTSLQLMENYFFQKKIYGKLWKICRVVKLYFHNFDHIWCCHVYKTHPYSIILNKTIHLNKFIPVISKLNLNLMLRALRINTTWNLSALRSI
jgi:hypothetical protein